MKIGYRISNIGTQFYVTELILPNIGAKKYFFRVAGFFQKKCQLEFFCNVACSAPLHGTSLAFANNATTFTALGCSAQL